MWHTFENVNENEIKIRRKAEEGNKKSNCSYQVQQEIEIRIWWKFASMKNEYIYSQLILANIINQYLINVLKLL